MKFSCDKKNLAEAAAGVSRAVVPSAAVPVLQGILLKADGFKLKLTGYDLEMAITTEIEVNVLEPGEIVLPAKLFNDMLRSLAGEEITLSSNEAMSTHIQSGITEYDLMGMSPADFPELPSPDAEKAFEIDAAELASMIEMTKYAVSTDDKKPALTGELFSIAPGELTVVAVDGFRLAIAKHPIVSDSEIDIVVPAKTVAEVSRLLGTIGGPVQVDANRRYVVFSGGHYTIMSRLIEGEFLNYRNVLPEGHKTRVVVDVSPFEKTIERSSIIISERLRNPLRLTFKQGGIDVKCETQVGRVSDHVEADMTGEKMEIGFNFRYLLDALRFSGSDKVVVELSGPLSPVKILPVEGDEFIFMVLPVRFNND